MDIFLHKFFAQTSLYNNIDLHLLTILFDSIFREKNIFKNLAIKKLTN